MRALTVAVFVGAVVAAIVIELFARARLFKLTSLGEMLAETAQSRITRVGIVAAWWWFGWHFLFAETVQLDL